MQSAINILVGTPGQILDHVTQGSLDLLPKSSVVFLGTDLDQIGSSFFKVYDFAVYPQKVCNLKIIRQFSIVKTVYKISK